MTRGHRAEVRPAIFRLLFRALHYAHLRNTAVLALCSVTAVIIYRSLMFDAMEVELVGRERSAKRNVLARSGPPAVLLLGFFFAATSVLPCTPRPASRPVGKTPLRITEKPQSATAFINSIGVNTHLNYFDRTYGDFQRVKTKLQSIGIRHLRDGIHFQDRPYNELVYGRWADLGAIGIRFDAVIDPRSKLGPLTPDLLERAEQLSNHSIEAFEGPNELDISGIPGWPAIDRDSTKSLFKAVRKLPAADRVEIFGPSLAFAKRGIDVGNLARYIDAGNLHPYPAGRMPSDVFPSQLEWARTVSGTKRIVVTESGYHNALNDHSDQPAVSEDAAAKYIPRLLLENFSKGIERTYLYELFDEASDPSLSNNQLHWGLVRADGSDKPAFLAVKRLINILASTGAPAHFDTLEWSIDSTAPQIHHLLLQKANGELDLVFWQEVTSYDIRGQRDIVVPPIVTVLTLDRRVRSATLYQPSIAAKPTGVYSDTRTIPLAIPDHPLIVRLSYR